MGSFSSTPKIENPDSEDDDVIPTYQPSSREELIDRCRNEIEECGRPPLLLRHFRRLVGDSPFVRVLQWNVLSQCLGKNHDCFVESAEGVLDWPARRIMMLQEIIQYNPDVICLQEVDHFRFLEAALGSIGYSGKFFEKPDSPCLYLADNNGPDGTAVFFRKSKFELISSHTRILEVWRIQSNQVSLACLLRERSTGEEICVAATHLKAKAGALLATLRDNQGKDLLNWLSTVSDGRPIVLCGDFNAEPTEPVYMSTTTHSLGLRSAYCVDGEEPRYTTWKIRAEGEICHTIDYIFHSGRLSPAALLEFPDEETIGPARVPSLHYPSDHFSLVADFSLRKA
ncbi:UNVERIFIED_CONTAM: hypothetical protein PYX00_001957 [Menopon gallinae]